MKIKHAGAAAELGSALKAIPRINRALRDKPISYYDSVYLELSSAEMSNGEGQGSNHYCYVPPATARKILRAALRIIKEDLKKMGVKT